MSQNFHDDSSFFEVKYFFVGEINAVADEARNAGQDIFSESFGTFCESEVGTFEGDRLVRVLKRALRARTAPTEGLPPTYAPRIFEKVGPNPNGWLRTISGNYESLNTRMAELAQHVDVLSRSLDRTIQIVQRRERVSPIIYFFHAVYFWDVQFWTFNF